MTATIAWCFDSEGNANECAYALREWLGSETACEVRHNREDEGYDLLLPSDDPEARAFVIAFAYARNDGTDMRPNPISREAAIEAARCIQREIASNPGTIPHGAVSADDAIILARYVLGLNDQSTRGDILGVIVSEVQT